MIQKKICMVGAFAVGKTSLVSRFVHSIFSEKYHTTVGVKIDKFVGRVDGNDVGLIIWDLAGEDELMSVRMSYLRGADGCLLVVDGTRRDTLGTARLLRTRIESAIGPVPMVFVFNKFDLAGEWEIDASRLDELADGDCEFVRASARTGDGVEAAFVLLARKTLRTSG